MVIYLIHPLIDLYTSNKIETKPSIFQIIICVLFTQLGSNPQFYYIYLVKVEWRRNNICIDF